MNSAATGFDVDKFGEWLTEVTGEAAELSVTPLRGGGSCEMFRVDRLGQAWVVRRAPMTAVSDTAHQVIREARIMEALGAAEFRCPPCWPATKTPAVLGAPFFVMSFVEGGVIRRNGLPAPLHDDPGSQGRSASNSSTPWCTCTPWTGPRPRLLRCPARHGFLYPAGRPLDDPARQLPGSRSARRRRDRVAGCRRNMPQHGDLTVMHGDYKLDNVIWAPAAATRISPASSTSK